MPYDPLEEVKHRNEFYRDSYRKLVVALLFSLIIIVALIGVIFGQLMTRPQPTYFATTEAGRIISLTPLNQPNLSDRALLQWASTAVVSVYSYDFVHWRAQFQNNKQYFTDNGWNAFLNAVKQIKGIDAVQQNKLVVSAVLTGAPVVTNRFLYNGKYTWKVEMPITVTFQGTSGVPDTQNLLVTLTVRRVSVLDNKFGVGIDQFVTAQR